MFSSTFFYFSLPSHPFVQNSFFTALSVQRLRACCSLLPSPCLPLPSSPHPGMSQQGRQCLHGQSCAAAADVGWSSGRPHLPLSPRPALHLRLFGSCGKNSPGSRQRGIKFSDNLSRLREGVLDSFYSGSLFFAFMQACPPHSATKSLSNRPNSPIYVQTFLLYPHPPVSHSQSHVLTVTVAVSLLDLAATENVSASC